ncbi:MAG: patatin-like phospholipase family protein [Muribaculaceae bacterium]|nr:patatin-like phospholipase family protein [Muribaculaceae bacterium]
MTHPFRHIRPRLSASLLLPLVLPFFPAASAASPDAPPGKRPAVGLVLSGGGAKGIAHVGVIKALEDNDIPIDCVTGTSMGAIVGSLYSCGWSPAEMMDFFTSTRFLDCSTGTIDPAYTYYFSQPAPTPQWVGLNISLNPAKDTGLMDQVLPSSLINPEPMSIEYLKLFTPYTAQCGENFDRLFVPYRCVTSDIYHKHKVVLSHGSLGDCVRASMSFPLVYKPIEMDGVLMYDGGIYDNFPVNVMESDFNPEFIIGVSVSSPDAKPQQGNIYEQLEDMIIQNNDYSVPPAKGVKIQVPVLDFGVLDFPDAPEIYNIGYQTGLAMVDSIKKRTPARRPLEEVTRRREKFARATPVIEYDSVDVSGATRRQGRYLKFLFDRGLDRPFGMDQAFDAYYRAVTSGKIADLLPQSRLSSSTLYVTAHDTTAHPLLSRNTLLLETKVKNPWTVGVGGWITSTTHSMLYLTLGYHTLNFNSLDVDLRGWIGQSYYAGVLSGKFTIQSRVPSYLELEAVASRRKFYDEELLFFEEGSPTFITANEAFVRINYAAALGRAGKAVAGIGYGHITDHYYPDNVKDYATASRDRTAYRTLAMNAGVEWNRLNFMLYPSSGKMLKAGVTVVHDDTRHTSGQSDVTRRLGGHWTASLKGEWKQFFSLHRNFRLGGAASGMATINSLYQNYTSTLIHAHGFAPTPSTRNYFNPAFRNDNFVAAGVMPIWLPWSKLQLRGDFYGYLPLRRVDRTADDMARHGGWFSGMQFIGEVAAVYNFPFAALSIYGNYLSSPARNWNFGINFGLYFEAPKLRQ